MIESIVNAGKKVAVLDRLKNAAGPFCRVRPLCESHDTIEEGKVQTGRARA